PPTESVVIVAVGNARPEDAHLRWTSWTPSRIAEGHVASRLMGGTTLVDPFAALRPGMLRAERFEGVIGRGRSRPLIVIARAGEVRRQIVLKLRRPGDTSVPWHLCLCREIVGAILARHLGLAVPDYYVVMIDDQFAEAMRGHPEEERI